MGVIISPNMNLPVPIVGGELGPQYATDANNCWNIIDAHNHTDGFGVQVPIAGLNYNEDFDSLNHRLTLLKSLTFTPQDPILPGVSPDVGAVYVFGEDLYYNDISGNQVRLTENGAVAGTPGSIANLVPPASASYSAPTFIWQSDVDTPAIMDGGPIIIRDLDANANGITIQSPVSLPSDYSITLPSDVPGDTSLLAMDNSGNIVYEELASLNPPGAITMYGGSAAPTGYLLCNGQAVSRTTYSALFAAIGTNFGEGNATTTFNVPDFRGVFPRGQQADRALDGQSDQDANDRIANPSTTGGATGNNVGSFQQYANKAHSHGADHTHDIHVEVASGTPNFKSFIAAALQPTTTTKTNDAGYIETVSLTTGVTGANQSMPNNIYVTFIIKT